MLVIHIKNNCDYIVITFVIGIYLYTYLITYAYEK